MQPRGSERELQHQLHDARRRERVENLAERRRIRDIHGALLDGEVRMIQDVEGFDLERRK